MSNQTATHNGATHHPVTTAGSASGARRGARVFARLGVACGIIASFALAGLAAAAPASAHDALESATPESGSVITADPGEVVLTFSDELVTLNGETNAFAVQVTDPTGAYRQNGCVTVSGTSASTLMMLGEAGTYTVLWQVVSSDGHPTSGTYTFDYQAPSDAAIMPGVATPPACGDLWAGSPASDIVTVTPTTTTVPEPQTDAPVATPEATVTVVPSDAQSEPVNMWVVIALAVVSVGIIGTVVAIIVRKTRNDPFATPPAGAPESDSTDDTGSGNDSASGQAPRG